MNRMKICSTVLLLVAFHRPLLAQTAYPMLMSLQPLAARIGHTTEHTVKSRYSMHGAFAVLVTGTGVTGEIVTPEARPGDRPNVQEARLRFTVAPDARPGVRDFRIATPRGASTLGQLVLVRDPVVAETRDNDTAESAPTVELPAAICGAVEKNEDVDYYRFRAAAGQRFSFHVRSMRLQDRIHDLQTHIDPILTIRNAQGLTVASNDNYFAGDPFLHHQFDQGGDFFLEIRDVRYKGNPYWEYCIEVTDQPFVTNVFPSAVARGQAALLQLVGYQLPGQPMALVRFSESEPCGVGERSLPLGDSQLNPVALVVSDEPVCIEQSVNNDSPTQGQFAALPTQIAGRIEREGDVDCYAFAALRGEKYSFEVMARRQGSALDSHLRILGEKGNQLALNDDLRSGKRGSSDSLIEGWTAPADGVYAVEIRDLHGRGGPDFVYALHATRAVPGFRLWVDTDKTQLTPGTSSVLFVRCERLHGFAGEIQLAVSGLPHAVTASCGRILPQGQDGCIVLAADPDAPCGAANITVSGTGTADSAGGAPGCSLVATANCYQEIYQPGGGRGHWPSDMHTVCVGERSDIWSVRLSDHDITLRPGESKSIGVTIDRAPGFDKNVTLDVTFNHLNSIYGDSLPPGVKLDLKASRTLLTGTNTEGVITLTAARNAAPASRQQIAVMANVSLNFVMKATYSSSPLLVTVAPPAQ